jgi:hypothetical protein
MDSQNIHCAILEKWVVGNLKYLWVDAQIAQFLLQTKETAQTSFHFLRLIYDLITIVLLHLRSHYYPT